VHQDLGQNDRALERHLVRADLDSPRHHDEMLLYEERLSRPQLRRVLTIRESKQTGSNPSLGTEIGICA